PLTEEAADAPQAKPASATSPAVAFGTMRSHQYIRIDGEKNGIVNAADDGRYMYIAFAGPVPDGVLFFDQEGQAVTGAASGRVAALPRIFRTGVLVRTTAADSYIAPNPRATSNDRPPLESDPEVVDARMRLELAATALPNFRQARERADATMRAPGNGTGLAAPVQAPAQTSAIASATTYQVPPLPTLKPARSGDPSYEVLPDGVMVRVFFASGGRAIVRPDDGLQRMEAEADSASVIRISGFTDSVGSDEANAALARQRAEAIRDLLIRRRVSASKIFVTWSGAGRYIADNDTSLGRALNRRVEVIFLRAKN
ncbi:MAG: OmpA family protein, partial [Vicinamibacterales bacterium]